MGPDAPGPGFWCGWSTSPSVVKRTVARAVRLALSQAIWAMSPERAAHLNEHLDQAGVRSLLHQFLPHAKDVFSNQPANLRPFAAMVTTGGVASVFVAFQPHRIDNANAVMAVGLLVTAAGCLWSEDRLRAGRSFAFRGLGVGTAIVSAGACYELISTPGMSADAWLLRAGLVVVGIGVAESTVGCVFREPGRLGEGVRVAVHGALVCAVADAVYAVGRLIDGEVWDALATAAVGGASVLIRLALPPFELRCAQQAEARN